MLIRILARQRKEKGDLFEEFMEKALDSAGYEDFKRDVRKTGRQIDLYARHKVTGQPILCECKAHTDKIGTADFHKFYGVYEKEYQQNNKLIGLLFSLSGFNSTTLEAYDELSSDVKNRFLLFDGNSILSMLRKTKILASEDKLDYILKTRIKYALGERYLIHTRSGTYWVQLIMTDNKVTHYIVLGPKGEEVPKYICSEIGLLDANLKNLKLLDIYAMKKVLANLFDGLSKTPEEISKETTECVETVNLSLHDLISQSLVVCKENHTYHLAKELTSFIDLAKQFLGSENELDFYLSQYSEEMMNMALVNYVEQRFRLELDSRYKEALLQLLKISPSALHEVLFKSVETYKTTEKHIKELTLSQQKRNEIMASQSQDFIGSLLRRLIGDLEKQSSKEILTKRGVKGYRTKILAVLAGLEKQHLFVETEGVVMILPAAGRIESGQLVSVTNYDLYIDIGLVLANLGKPEKAIKCYDEAITHLLDPDKLKAAWNNKGLSLMTLKRYDEAIECFDRATAIDDNLKEAWYNKGLAYALKGEREKAIDCVSKALKIDPNYTNAQRTLKELQSQHNRA